MENFRKPKSLFFPLLLITAGILIFLTNIGTMEGTTWDTLLQYWPVILILGGLDGLYKRDGWVGPLVLIGLGTVLLLGNLHYLENGALTMLLRLWPILLVAIGLDILFGHRGSVWNNVIRIGLGLLLVAGIVWVTAASPSIGTASRDVPYSQNLDGAKTSEINVGYSVGEINLAGGADKGMLISGTANLPKDVELVDDYSAPINGRSRLSLKSSDAVILLINTDSEPWDLEISSLIPVELQAQLGVGELYVDLSDTQVTSLTTEMGVGQTIVTLPEGVDINAKISAGIGELVIRLPKGSQVSIETDTAIVGTDIPEGYLRNGDRISSPSAGTGAPNINLEIDLGIGSVQIEVMD